MRSAVVNGRGRLGWPMRIFGLALGAALFGGASAHALPTFTLSGYVWVDTDKDNRLSVWEPKQAGITIRLLNASTKLVMRTAKTDAAGNFAFRNLAAGTYGFAVVPTAGFVVPTAGLVVVAGNKVKNVPLGSIVTLEETTLNPFGDPWKLARANTSLPLVGATGCYRELAPGMRPLFKNAELQFLTKLGAPFYLEGCADLLETTPPYSNATHSSDSLKARIRQLDAANPSGKYLLYWQVVNWQEGLVGWSEIATRHKGWFVYQKGAAVKNDSTIVRGLYGQKLLDITNPAYQDYLAKRAAEVLADYKADGVLIDLFYPLAKLADVNQVPDATRAKWVPGLIALLKKLKTAIGPDRVVFVNTPRDNPPFARAVMPYLDGVMLEDTFSPARGNVLTNFKVRKPIIDAAEKAGKYIMTTVNTYVDGSVFPTTTAKLEHDLQRYYLAAFYIFNQGKMLLYYSPPTSKLPQYGAESFFSDWNVNVGTPTGPYLVVPGYPKLYMRKYTNAVVYLNDNTSSTVTLTPPVGFSLGPDKKTVKSYQLGPKSGFFFVRTAAFQ